MKSFDQLLVLDLSQGVAGPYCTMYLADLGCRVIKIEPSWGDWGRTMGVAVGKGGSVVFSALNRRKQSCLVDAQVAEGRQLLRSIAGKADVLVESFRPGVMDRLGLGWPVAHDLNPRLIYCSITAFGPSGPYRDKKGTDSILQGMAGLMSIIGEEGGRPIKMGLSVSDMFAGVLAGEAILSSLMLREQDGRGRHIEISLMEALLELQRVQIAEYLITGKLPVRKGNAHAHIAPSRSFRTSDGEIMVAVISSGDWTNFCNAMELDDATRAEFTDPRVRVWRRAEINALVEPTFLKRTSREWMELLERHDVLCGVIHEYDTLLQDPHVESLDVVDRDHSTIAVRSPVRLVKGTSWPATAAAPELGADTSAVLAEFGLEPGSSPKK